MAIWLFCSILGYRIARERHALSEDQIALNRQLEQRILEIGTLNVELQRKVGDRSRELAAALRRLYDEGRDGLAVGAMLADRYRVARRIGAGAMGEVYEVERIADGQAFAAKVVRGRIQPDTLERFTREAELAARIEHPHVVRVFDVDVSVDGELFLVMELVAGRSLEQERARFGDRAFARRVLGQVASALAAIHAGGVVHRDLKPANILVTGGDDPIAKVADFGIAGTRTLAQTRVGPDASDDETIDAIALESTISVSEQNARSPRRPEVGVIMGTPLYMAPELFAGVGLARSPVDLYSFGIVAYQLLVGIGIETDRSKLRAAAQHAFGKLAPPLSVALTRALGRCLHEEPTRRPTAEALAKLFASEPPID